MNGQDFTLRPKHWWGYLNPWWWKRKRIIEAVMQYQWEKEGREKAEKAIMDSILYGEGRSSVDWKSKGEESGE